MGKDCVVPKEGIVWEIPFLDFSMDCIQDPSFFPAAHVLWLGMAC